MMASNHEPGPPLPTRVPGITASHRPAAPGDLAVKVRHVDPGTGQAAATVTMNGRSHTVEHDEHTGWYCLSDETPHCTAIWHARAVIQLPGPAANLGLVQRPGDPA